jgi:flagellar FliL protein
MEVGMSDKIATEAPAKGKGKGLIVKLLLGVVLIGAGGGGAYALVSIGVIGHKNAAREDNTPKLVRKGDKDPYAPPVADNKEGAAEPVYGDGGSPYRTAYFNFSEDFTVNLRNSDTLLQASLACSTQYDGRVLGWLKAHELAIRSAMLATMADTSDEDVATPEGKDRLQKRLTAAINKVLVAQEGFGGVNAVYFKSFIVQ